LQKWGIHRAKVEVDPDEKLWADAIAETDRLISEWKISDVHHTRSSTGNGRYEIFNRRITALTQYRDNIAHSLKNETFPAAKGKSVKVKASALIEAVQNEGERLFTDSPFQGA